jgi:hypothetical protein
LTVSKSLSFAYAKGQASSSGEYRIEQLVISFGIVIDQVLNRRPIGRNVCWTGYWW